jgi:hypothetical protein
VKQRDILAPAGWYEFESTPRTLDQLITHIRQIQANASQLVLWRGLNNSRYANVSALDRYFSRGGKIPGPFEVRERGSRKFSSNNLRYRISGNFSPTIQAKMQHEAVPTRYIDVTLSPLVSLWFASESSGHATDGRILAFDVFDRTATVNPLSLPYEEEEYFNAWIPESGLHPWIDAQHGAFIFGKPLDEDFKDEEILNPEKIMKASCIPYIPSAIPQQTSHEIPYFPRCYSIRIPKELKQEILDYLAEVANIHHASLFPGYRGLAQAHNAGLIPPNYF